jgi:hypothetical protein
VQSPVEWFLRQLDGKVISFSLRHPVLRTVEHEVGAGYYRFPDRITFKDDEATIDWSRVIRLRFKDNDDACDLTWHEIWRIPGYVQPPYLLSGSTIMQALTGTRKQAGRVEALFFSVCRGVERLLDVSGLDAESRESDTFIWSLFNLRTSLDPEVWTATTTLLARLPGVRWVDPVEELLKYNGEEDESK